MKSYLMFLSACLLLVSLVSNTAFAVEVSEPIITNNVTIMTNVSASQCPSSWNGTAGEVVMRVVAGANTGTGVDTAAVQSCTGCAINSANDCVCSTCYIYAN